MEDSQLIAYLDRKFEDLRQEMNQRFEQVDQRFEQVDQRFEQSDQRFNGMDQRFDRLEQRLGKVEDEVHGLHVLNEELRDKIATVAEGVIGVDEKLEAFRGEMRKELREIRDTHQRSYSNLDRRVRKVEKVLNLT